MAYPLMMAANFDVPLTSDEFDALAELNRGLLKRAISPKHRAKILKLGLITREIGGDVLTDAGKLRLARGK
jgi:hypothetical protein